MFCRRSFQEFARARKGARPIRDPLAETAVSSIRLVERRAADPVPAAAAA